MSKQKFVGSGDLAMRPEAVGLLWPRSPGSNEWDASACREGVAVIKVCGPLEHHGGWWFDSYEKILGRVEGAMQDEDVKAIILDIDSPGGEVSGLNETVARIRSMRAQYGKKIVAYADDDAYSAAYALACSADEIYLPKSGGVGSIGVIAEIVNLIGAAEKQGVKVAVVRSGNRKADGHPFLPLDDATIARVQTRIDVLAKQFFALVSESRGVPRKSLEALQGACIYGQKAVDAGLADGIASFEDVFSALSEESIDSPPSSTVSFNPNDRSEGRGEQAAMFEVLKKKVASTASALEAATTPNARKKAMAAYAAAVEALAAAKVTAKVKKTYTKKTVEEESEEDDGEEDDDGGDDDGGDDDDDSSGDASAADADDDDGAEEEETKKSKKSKKASADGSILSFVKSLTGQSSTKAAKEVLASMHETAQQAALATDRIAKLEAAAVESKRTAIIGAMMQAGQLKPSQLEWAKGQSIKSLKAYGAATPAMFAPRQRELSASEPMAEAPDADGLTDFERKLCKEQGITVESYKKTRDNTVGAPAPKVN